MAEPSAGALLRAAREKQGLHIAALAAAIKVPPKKLEALEADRWDELSGVIFTRALAQSVCRVLRIDSKPVLALLPQPETLGLEGVTGSLNAPFRDRDGRVDRAPGVSAQQVLVGSALLLMLAAAVLFLLPVRWWSAEPVVAAVSPAPPASTAAVQPVPAAATTAVAVLPAGDAAAAASAPAAAASGGGAAAASPTVAALPAAAPAAEPSSATAAAAAAASAAAALRIEAVAASWVEVRERGGRVLISRQLAPREAIGLDGNFPLTVTVGNVAGTKVTLRGAPIDLVATTRNNVARVEVQ